MFRNSTAISARQVLMSTILLFGTIFMMTCGGDSGTTPDDDGGVEPRVLSIAFSATSASPGDHITVTGIPDDVEWAFAVVTVASTTKGATAQTEPGIGLIEKTESGHELIAPVHPTTPMQGGSVEIEITNGTNITSNTVSLDVEALTPAPGAFDAAITKLEALLDAWIAQEGTTAEALRSTAADQLTPAELSLLLFHTAINHPDNPNSLAAFADGDIPLHEGDPVDRDVLDALTARSRVTDWIDHKLSFTDTLTAPSASARGLLPTGTVNTKQLDCIEAPTFDIGPGNCDKLAELMAYQGEMELEKVSSADEYIGDLTNLLAAALAYVSGGATVAWGITNTAWAADNIESASAGLYPSFFISEFTDYTADPEVIPEDFSSPPKWSDFVVTASSGGWRFDDVIKDALKKVKGLKGGFRDKTVEGLFVDLTNGKGLKDLKKKLEKTTKNAVYDQIKEAINYDELTRLEYCTRTWQNINCTGLPYSSGSSPDLTVDDNALTYVPSEVGVTTLEVKTTGAFGVTTPTAETKTIETRQIVVTIDPFQAIVEVNTPVSFTAIVANAENDTVEWYTEGPLPRDLQPDGNDVTVVTPLDPWSPPITLKARSMSNTGLRENAVNSDPREGEATISNGSPLVVVTPIGECVMPGEDATFTATIVGSEDSLVTWSTDPPNTGTFNGDVYTAPNFEAGTVVIIATSVANPSAKGYASVRVADCTCWWTAFITGDRLFNWTGSNAVFGVQTPGITSVTFESQVSGPGIHYPVISGFVLAGAGAVGTFTFTGTVEANDTDFWTAGDPSGEQMVELLISSNDGQTMEGRLTGPFFRVVGGGDPPETETIFLNHRFKATDGFLGLCQD